LKIPKTTVILISINIVFFVIVMALSFGQLREIIRIEQNLRQLNSQMNKIEKEFISFKEVMEGTSGYINVGEARREFERTLRKKIEEGKIIPPGTPEYERWSSLYAHFKTLQQESFLKKETFLFNRLGFISKSPKPLPLLVSSFLHLNLFALFFNLLFFFVVGRILEERWGEYFLALIYLGGGIFSSLIHWTLNPSCDIPIIGSGSSVAILMGIFIAAYYREKIKLYFLVPSTFLFVTWLIQAFFQPIFEPLPQVVKGQGILVPLVTLTLGVVVGLAKTGKLSRATPTQKPTSQYYRMIAQGNELLELANFDKAKWVFERVLKREPDNLEAHEGLARIHRYRKEDKEAISEYNQVVSLALKRGEGVIEKYEAFRKAYPETLLEPENEYRVARTLEKSEKLDEAIEVYRKVSASYPKHELAPRALYGIGKIYLRLDRKEEAVNSLREILRLYPQVDWIDQVKEDIERAKALGY